MRSLLIRRAALLLAMLLACLHGWTAAGEEALTAANLLERSKGQVVVLLMGMEACSNTRANTTVLAEYAKTKPEGVAIVRVDAPAPGTEAEPVADWKQPYAYVVDEKRTLAEKFEFFYYPTLFILDKEGAPRFAGNCELEKIKQMVAEIQAEKPGSPKKVYTPPLPAVGSDAAAFTGKTLDGKEVKLETSRGKKGTVLFFGSSACPFSVQALDHVKKLAEEYAKQEVSVLVINKAEPAESVRKVYAQHDPKSPVVLDSDGAIFKSYAMEPVPFFFVLNAAGKITHRRPFTAEAATADVKAMLEGKSAPASKGCGAG